jgi:hypothetical protein
LKNVQSIFTDTKFLRFSLTVPVPLAKEKLFLCIGGFDDQKSQATKQTLKIVIKEDENGDFNSITVKPTNSMLKGRYDFACTLSKTKVFTIGGRFNSSKLMKSCESFNI